MRYFFDPRGFGLMKKVELEGWNELCLLDPFGFRCMNNFDKE